MACLCWRLQSVFTFAVEYFQHKLPPFLCLAALASMTEIARPFWEFLQTVDIEKAGRNSEFLKKAATAFMLNDANDEYDLIGFDCSELGNGARNTCCVGPDFAVCVCVCVLAGTAPSGGIRAFMRRAVRLASAK